MNENKDMKSLTNTVDSRRGAWIGPAASTGEVRVWKLLKIYFHFLNTILKNYHDRIITKIKWRGLSIEWVSEWFHLLSFLIAIWEDFSYEDWEIPRGGEQKLISLFLEALLRCRKKSFLGSGPKQFLLSVEIFSLERVRLEVELHSADCLGWHLGSDSEAADF